jgi:hypothetical protein
MGDRGIKGREMKQFYVFGTQTITHGLEVEAENKDAAIEQFAKAMDGRLTAIYDVQAVETSSSFVWEERATDQSPGLDLRYNGLLIGSAHRFPGGYQWRIDGNIHGVQVSAQTGRLFPTMEEAKAACEGFVLAAVAHHWRATP